MRTDADTVSFSLSLSFFLPLTASVSVRSASALFFSSPVVARPRRCRRRIGSSFVVFLFFFLFIYFFILFLFFAFPFKFSYAVRRFACRASLVSINAWFYAEFFLFVSGFYETERVLCYGRINPNGRTNHLLVAADHRVAKNQYRHVEQ